MKETIRISSSSAIVLVLFTLAFTGLMATTFFATKPAIDESIRAEKMQLIGEVLPESLYDNDLLADGINLPPVPALTGLHGTAQTALVEATFVLSTAAGFVVR